MLIPLIHGFSNSVMGSSDQGRFKSKASVILILTNPLVGFGKVNAFQSISSLLG
jgi:hypothetical protein